MWMKVLHIGLCLILIPLLAVPACGLAVADRGGIPIDPRVEFDENAQNAIAAWNGTDEVLILSTDLRSTAPGRLLEVLPLPASPYEVKEGDISSFSKMIGLFNQKAERLQASSGEELMAAGSRSAASEQAYSGITISFLASIGAHNITVVHVENQTHFVDWVRDFAAGMGVGNFTVAYKLNDSVGAHLSRGISYFVFDVVELSGDLRTLAPVVYKFRTDLLYYPLNITGATLPHSAMADHRIKVFLVMKGVMRDQYAGGMDRLSHGPGFDEYIQFSHDELGQVSKDISAMFPTDAFVCYVYNRAGYMHEEDLCDITIRAGDIRRPTADELNRQEFKVAIRPLSPSLAYLLLDSIVEPATGPGVPVLMMIMAGVLLAPLPLGYIHNSLLKDRLRGRSGWIAWLAIYYFASLVFLLAARLFGQYQPTNGMDYLAVVCILLVPAAIAYVLGTMIVKKRLTYDKRRYTALAYGMGIAQVAGLVFLPSSVMATMTAFMCFPGLMIMGLAMLLTVLVEWMNRKGEQYLSWDGQYRFPSGRNGQERLPPPRYPPSGL